MPQNSRLFCVCSVSLREDDKSITQQNKLAKMCLKMRFRNMRKIECG